MAVPFSVEQFFGVFAAYNQAVWPAQLVGYSLGVLVVGWIILRRLFVPSLVFVVLGVMWLWNGIAYHFAFFTTINPAAYAFSAMFVVQGVAFLVCALRVDAAPAPFPAGVRAWLAAVLIAYAMVVYAILGMLMGHRWPHNPVFGVAPCPTTIFTLGMLMLGGSAVSVWLWIIPLAWAMIGSTAAVFLSVPEDFGLLAAGLIGLVSIVMRPWRTARPQ